MKKTIAILALAALAVTSANAEVHFGISFGIPVVGPAPVVLAPAPVVVPPPMPAPIVEVTPACPVPGYIWVGGTWGWSDNHWVWTGGHWGPPAHWDRDAYWGHGYRAERHDGFRGGFHAEHGRR